MKRWAVAGAILLLGLGGCRKAVVVEPPTSQEHRAVRLAARPGALVPERIQAAPSEGDDQPPPRIQGAPPDDEPAPSAPPRQQAPPSYSRPPATVPPVAQSPRPAARRLTKAEVVARLKKNLQPAFIDVTLTDYGGGRYAGTAKDTAYTDIPIRVNVDYSNTITYQIGVPDALVRGKITPDGRHTNTMHIKP